MELPAGCGPKQSYHQTEHNFEVRGFRKCGHCHDITKHEQLFMVRRFKKAGYELDLQSDRH